MSQNLQQLGALLRYYSIVSTTTAGSGHPTSCLSAADLMATLFFDGHFRYDPTNPNYHNNDRLIFSKGHAAPLFYALWLAADQISDQDILSLRKFNSPIEGHPTMTFPYSEAATGSLGQGLSIGVGMALNAKYLDKTSYHTFVLLGDSEMAEGSNWEALQLAAHYKLDNLVGILDINRLGQRGETMDGHDTKSYARKIASFGWEVLTIDGHNYKQISKAFKKARKQSNRPTMIVAKTVKGKGVSFLENQEGWHGKALSEAEAKKAITELGSVDTTLRGSLTQPPSEKLQIPTTTAQSVPEENYTEALATRKAYGHALVQLGQKHGNVIVLDAETSNSTYSNAFNKAFPDRFFEMFIAEQNMVGVAAGLGARGKLPFVSTFSAFLTRAHDQIRMARYSESNITFVGSHGGVSIGEDGPSQMGLEDIAQFRAILDSVILYPADHVAQEKLTEQTLTHQGITYIRTTRPDTEPLYKPDETFTIGGSKTLCKSNTDVITIVAAGITVYEALAAHNQLRKEDIVVRVIDLYSIKPLDIATLQQAAKDTKAIVTVEDHYLEGGLGEAVTAALGHTRKPIYRLAVTKMPKSGTMQELLDYEEISSAAIIQTVKEILKK